MSEQLAVAREFRTTAEQLRRMAPDAINGRIGNALIQVALAYDAMAGTMEATDHTLKTIGWPHVLKPAKPQEQNESAFGPRYFGTIERRVSSVLRLGSEYLSTLTHR